MDVLRLVAIYFDSLWFSAQPVDGSVIQRCTPAAELRAGSHVERKTHMHTPYMTHTQDWLQCKHVQTHKHTHTRSAVIKRWHRGWSGRRQWLMDPLPSLTLQPSCHSVFLFPIPPSLFFYALTSSSLTPSVFFLSSARPPFLTRSVITPPRSPSSPAPFPHPSLSFPLSPHLTVTFIFTHLYRFPPSPLSDNVTA